MRIFAISSNNKNIKANSKRDVPTYKGVTETSSAAGLLNKLGLSINIARITADDIFKTYSRPERGYHGIKHIIRMLNSFDKFLLESKQSYMIQNENEFRFAILMHDYVNGECNEVEKSAVKAREILHKISDNYNSSYVEKLILATDYSKKQSLNFEQKLMQDIDIEILGRPSDEYKKYSEEIRAQYSKYSDEIFNPARIKILKSFLDRESIYNIEYYKNKYEIQAKKNIEQEIEDCRLRILVQQKPSK